MACTADYLCRCEDCTSEVVAVDFYPAQDRYWLAAEWGGWQERRR